MRAAPLFASSPFFEPASDPPSEPSHFPFSDDRLIPHYPSESPLANVLRLVHPGSDEYITEKYASEIDFLLKQWGDALRGSVGARSALEGMLAPSIEASTFGSATETTLRSDFGIRVVRRKFDPRTVTGAERFRQEIEQWLGREPRVITAEFEIFGIEQIAEAPLTVRLEIRYDLVTNRSDDLSEERVGAWRTEWSRDNAQQWRAHRWEAIGELLSVAHGPVFVDVTSSALGREDSYQRQLMHGTDYWRTVLDGAIGADVYSNNGVAAGDFDNDGFDDIYVCQPAGLPNRLYRNRGDGTLEDVTERAGVGVLDSTACALFADFQNRGLQDLLVVCGTGPLLFVNQGDGTFKVKLDAFKFERPPQGTFTHAAIADYDRDGHLDIYFCLYMYYLGLDQYHYPIPYYDARNGPPNCLFHNQGDGTFVETTEASGLNTDNDRYSFSCAWGDSNSNGLPDLFVANDFGSSQLYRNNGNGTFTVASRESHVEDVGAGMGCAWCDYDNDGHQDVYVPSMWEAAGQRVSSQRQFHESAPKNIRELYQRHARGNALYRNQGDGTFRNVGYGAGVEMGRWSWSSDFFDFDHDGYSDLYVTNGYLSAINRDDVASFFWRQVVAKSSEDATPALAYERGWNAINELVRSDSTWHGFARNVMFVNHRDGTFSEISGPSGLDFIEDSRTFVLADLDHDGRLEIILKNRNAPQVRVLHNAMKDIGHSVAFRLRGHKSNRDAIGTSVTIESESLRQTKYVQSGTGFLAQHSRELFFGLGTAEGITRAIVRWPSGLTQEFHNLPGDHRIEIEEGLETFVARPFAAKAIGYANAEPAPTGEALPAQVHTWLVDPLKAPNFALPDQSGKTKELSSLQGSFVLLSFWATTAPVSLDQLKLLNRSAHPIAASLLQTIAVNVDGEGDKGRAIATAARLGSSLTVVFASAEVAGIYNIIYRHLFDRRRDLGIPSSFLLDRQGLIVKVYQGLVDPQIILSDVKMIPTAPVEQMKRALPFPGELYRATFARNDFTYGVALFQHGYLKQAEESFREVVASKPNDPDAYYNLGTLALRRNDFQQARRYLEQTLKLRPNYPEAWNNLGMMAAQQGRPEEAIQNFQRSLELRPDYAIAFLNLGNIYRHEREFSKAEESLRHALSLQPDDPEINYSLGMLCAQQEQLQSASQFLHKAIAMRPNYPEAINNLGVLYVKERDYSEAELQFQAGIRVAPEYDQSYINLARLYTMRSNKEQAVAVLQKLVARQPQNDAARHALDELQSTP
jgi:tetratricopeptide (TPR) repeat protein